MSCTNGEHRRRRLLPCAALAFACAVLAGGATAQRDPGASPGEQELLTSRVGTEHRPLYAVAFDESGRFGVAVGGRGTILETDDGGGTWREQSVDGQLALLAVAVSGEQAFAAGQMGLVYRRSGAGNWEKLAAGTDERFLTIAANGDGLVVAAGAFSVLRVSMDGGQSWADPGVDFSRFVTEGYEPHLYSAAVSNDGRIFLAGEFGLIFASSDGGQSWEKLREGEESITDLTLAEDGHGYAVGQRGLVLRSDDGGSTWESLATGVDANLLGVAEAEDGGVLVAGMRRMLFSPDGSSFAPLVDADVNANWYASAAASSRGLFAVGHQGRIILIDPGGG